MRSLRHSFNPRTQNFALAALLAAGVALAVFQDVSDDQDEADGQASDWRILKALRRDGNPGEPLGPAWLKESMVEVSALGSITVLTGLTAATAGGLLIAGKRRHALLTTGVFVGALALSEGLKNLFKRSRPPVEYRAVDVVNENFPSGHALLSAATYLSLGILVAHGAKTTALRNFAILTGAATAASVGISRIFLGVHWTNDVLGGWAAGSAWAATCWVLGDRRR